MRLQEIKERLEKYTLAEDTDNDMSVEDFTASLYEFRTHCIADMNYLIERVESYSSVNIKLTQDYVDSEAQKERLKDALKTLRDHGKSEWVVNLHYSKLFVFRIADDVLKEME